MNQIVVPPQALYPIDTKTLDVQAFRHPPAIYRAVPFWAWNGPLHEEQLIRQIHMLKDMGMGGFHIHPRTGLTTPYLGPEFLDLVQRCVTEAAREGLHVWLYDEDRWPSGAAGGLVTQDPAYRARHLLFTPFPYGDEMGQTSLDASARAKRAVNGTLIARYHVIIRDGVLAHYRRLRPGEPEPPDGQVWYAYLETALPSPWFNNQTYVDTLNPAAIRRFLELTHERYAERVGNDFGTIIPGIFTDEPQFPHKEVLGSAEELRDLILPCTGDFFATYAQTYGQRLEDVLPEVIWDLPNGQASVARYHYHDHVCARFTEAFVDQIGAWCAEHGLRLTGHMMEEPTLGSQTAALGETMRAYRGFQIPGIDMLFDWHEYTTAKQAQSAVHQYGREGMVSELYGVTNWDFDFIGHKAQGDWQAALGVTVRVPHLAWLTMAGEAKRDFPASINYQSPWWREYPLIEDHFARVTMAMTRGTPIVHVGVIHPIESYWLSSGPLTQTQAARQSLEDGFSQITDWLLFGLIDFDFIAESLFPALTPDAASVPLQVGHSAYEIIVVPGLQTMRRSTFQRLQAFQRAGGQVVFAGTIPHLIEAQPTDEVGHFAQNCIWVPFERDAILASVASAREIDVRHADDGRVGTMLHQLRADGDDRFVFLCNTDGVVALDDLHVRLRGEWIITQLDTLSGQIAPLSATYADDATLLIYDVPAHGSLLLHLTPGQRVDAVATPAIRWQSDQPLPQQVAVQLSEPNVLLLDRASYRLDGGDWQAPEEILRLDNAIRQQLGWPLRMEALAQPWTQPLLPPTHTLELRFAIESTVNINAPLLATEDASQVHVTFDGRVIDTQVTGWFVDEAIQTIVLPPIAPGRHTIMLSMPYGPMTNPEWVYLLGDFGVTLAGTMATLTDPIRALSFGDWTTQGLPFYAGNVTYLATISLAGHRHALYAPHFRAPLLNVALDGQRVGPIAFAPFRLDLGESAPGQHDIAITAFGNRVNAFGPLHNATPGKIWVGPNAWRTQGAAWTDSYRLTPMGILSPPTILYSEEAAETAR